MKFRSILEYLDFKMAIGFLKLATVSRYLGFHGLKDFFIECGDQLAGKYYDIEEVQKEIKSWEYLNDEEFEQRLKELNLIEKDVE